MVAFGMVGASISGVTFVSVPGMVLHSDMTYLQTCMGFILGYFVVAFVLLPIYYKMNLTSIYTVLRGISDEAYKTGAAIFIFSKLIGTAAKFFVPCYIISMALGTNYYLTTIVLFVLIWLYTRRGGIKTLVWTDTVQTLCMLVALLLIIYNVYGAVFSSQFLDEPSVGLRPSDYTIHNSQFSNALSAIAASSYSRIFEFDDWSSPNNFFKCFISGIFIVVVMTGLDQDMMQKNLTCKTLRDAQKDMCTYGFAFLPVNALFLVLGIMLTMLYAKEGIALPERPDELLSQFTMHNSQFTVHNSQFTLALFLIGIVSTSFSTVDSSLTALTTTFCVDIRGVTPSLTEKGKEPLTEKGKEPQEKKGIAPQTERGIATRKRVHLGMTIALILCTMAFGLVSTSSLIDTIYRIVSYTYGPLLGLFAYSLTPRLTPNPSLVERGTNRVEQSAPANNSIFSAKNTPARDGHSSPLSKRGGGGESLICLASPLICLALDMMVPRFTGYHFGYELLLINGMITYLLLVVMSLTPLTSITPLTPKKKQ